MNYLKIKTEKYLVILKMKVLKMFGLMNLFVYEVKCIRLNLEMIIKTN